MTLLWTPGVIGLMKKLALSRINFQFENNVIQLLSKLVKSKHYYYGLFSYTLFKCLWVGILFGLWFLKTFSVIYCGWKGHSEVCFYLKHSAGCFKYPAGCFFARSNISNIRPNVYLNNAFVIQYQNTRPVVSENLVSNLHYLVFKLCSKNIRPGICNKFRNKNQNTRSNSLK